ncbi:ImmA/IrrE family metallo-endopeptidase [Paenibacillus yanchengensis]|uniref:ImmA/IrrE family metallo-endopeptidase n=1 Tax=Paenibacillus yanchengensis TaxID=2035833 RepID=A0ABW4YNJ4_9BACL
MAYDALVKEAMQQGIDIYEMPMKPRTKGLYADKTIWINKGIETEVEKSCVLAEELGHYYTSQGHILDQQDIRNRKQELKARHWAYEKLIPLSQLVNAAVLGNVGRHLIAEWLNVTESFLQQSIEYYQRKYGIFTTWKNYIIFFEPLSVSTIRERLGTKEEVSYSIDQ